MNYRLGTVEKRFAEIIWREEPVSSGKLAEICREELDWKKSTTYTVLKRLSEKGFFQNEGGLVQSLISREDYNRTESAEFIEESFGGSLPAFLTAFTSGKGISAEEAEELKKLIDEAAKQG